MPALYPSQSAPENFQVGDCVRKFITDWNVSPYIGVVTQIVPATFKVWVQWPIGNSPEDPETLIRVNPSISGMPTVCLDSGYSSYEKSQSEKAHGSIPKRITPSRDLTKPMIPQGGVFPVFAKKITATDKMAIRIAHTFATNVVGKLVEDIVGCHKGGLTDIRAYNRIFEKYGNYCSDYIIRSSIERVYNL
jgi:hypothetical protein